MKYKHLTPAEQTELMLEAIWTLPPAEAEERLAKADIPLDPAAADAFERRLEEAHLQATIHNVQDEIPGDVRPDTAEAMERKLAAVSAYRARMR